VPLAADVPVQTLGELSERACGLPQAIVFGLEMGAAIDQQADQPLLRFGRAIGPAALRGGLARAAPADDEAFLLPDVMAVSAAHVGAVG
jgi:hypothetical protein